MKKSYEPDSSSYGSSVQTRNKSHMFKVFLRRLETKISSTSSKNKVNMVYLGIVFVLVGYLLVLSGFFMRAIISFASSNKAFFLTMHQFIKIDFQLRSSVNLINDEFLTVYTQLSPSMIGFTLDPVARQQAYLISDMADKELKSSFATNDYIGYYIDSAKQMRADWTSIIKDYYGNQHLKEFSDLGGEEIFKSQVSINVTGIVSKVNIINFLRDFYVRSRQSVEYLTRIRPFVANKEPPFALGPANYTALLNYLIAGFVIVQNCFDGVLSNLQSSMEIVVGQTLTSQTRIFNRNIWMYSCLLLTVIFIHLVASILVMRRINLRLFDLLATYRLLKSEEVDQHLSTISIFIEKLDQEGYNEIGLLKSYSSSGTSSEASTTGKSPSKAKLPEKKKGSALKRTRGIRLDRNFNFLAAKYYLLINLVFSVLFIAAYALFASSFIKLSSNLKIERLYYENYVKMIPVSNKYLSFINLLIFGNYVKIDGKYPEELFGDDSITGFNNFILGKNFGPYLTTEQNKKLDNILFKQICHLLSPSQAAAASIRSCCDKTISAQGGLLGILIEEEDLMKKVESEMLTLHTKLLEDSKKAIIPTPYNAFFFSGTMIRLRVMHDAAMDLYIKALFSFMDTVISSSFSLTIQSVRIVQTVLSVFVVFLLLQLALLMSRSIRRDMSRCAETFLIILPEVLYKNPNLQRAFDIHYFY